MRKMSGWRGLYFGGTAFKYRRIVSPEDYSAVAGIAAEHMDVVTTSGPGTGEAADPSKIAAFRAGVGERALAIASGITPENASLYAAADCFIVATGINKPGNFYEIDPARLSRLIDVAGRLQAYNPSAILEDLESKAPLPSLEAAPLRPARDARQSPTRQGATPIPVKRRKEKRDLVNHPVPNSGRSLRLTPKR
jgi:hypothetical protein